MFPPVEVELIDITSGDPVRRSVPLIFTTTHGNPINDGHYMTYSTMLAILGRMATYSGKIIRWEAALNSYKPFACGIVIHPTIDGCLQIRAEIGDDAFGWIDDNGDKWTFVAYYVHWGLWYNGLGGGAIALIAWSEFRHLSDTLSSIPLEIFIPILLSTVIGSISFWGSNIAFGKLQGVLPQGSIKAPGQQFINVLLLVGILVACVVLLADSGFHVDGVDFSPEMVERAKTKAQGRSQVQFLQADAAEPPLPPGAYDAVLSRHFLWAMADPAAALDRWIRLLKPQGILVLIEGRWSNNAGLPSDQTLELVAATGRPADLTTMSDPVYWGRAVDDERYMVVSAAPSQIAES
jgi:SAM-dependent methyltransferase